MKINPLGVRRVRCCATLIAAVAVVAAFATPAKAVPVLQLYAEGAVYDTDQESWVLEDAGTAFRLWTIGNVGGPGGHGTITEVFLAIAYDKSFGELEFSLTPWTTDGFAGFNDPTTPQDPVRSDELDPPGVGFVADSGHKQIVPTLSDGRDLPNHGAYTNVAWQEFALGDFTQTVSQTANFDENFDADNPEYASDQGSQINVYEVSILGPAEFEGQLIALHFDLYNHVQAGNNAKAKFAPFSHDAEAEPNVVPLPGGVLLGMAGFGLLGGLRVRQRLRGRAGACA